jgi:hypothetical protein
VEHGDLEEQRTNGMAADDAELVAVEQLLLCKTIQRHELMN